MPAKDQTRGQCNDHYRDVVELAGTVGAAVENNRDDQHNEACSQRAAGLDNTHWAAPRAQYGACTTGALCSLSTHNRRPLDDRRSGVENFFGLAGPWWIDALTVDRFLDALGGRALYGDTTVPALGIDRPPRAEIEARDVPIDRQRQHRLPEEVTYDIVARKADHRAPVLT